MVMIGKILSLNNPLVIGTAGTAGVEVAEVIPNEAIKLVCQVVIAVAALVRFFKDRKKDKIAE
jgi:hypothetical protein